MQKCFKLATHLTVVLKKLKIGLLLICALALGITFSVRSVVAGDVQKLEFGTFADPGAPSYRYAEFLFKKVLSELDKDITVKSYPPRRLPLMIQSGRLIGEVMCARDYANDESDFLRKRCAHHTDFGLSL
jgi:hypothetical protein